MENTNRKAFFFDYDGTIWFGRFSEKNLKALKKLHEKGHLLFYNSGRSKGNTRKDKVALIPFDGFLYGGSHIEYKGEDIFRRDIPKEVMSEIVALEKEYGLLVSYEGVNDIYKRKGTMPQFYGNELDDTVALLDTEKYPITKFSMIKEEDGNGGYVPIASAVLEKLSQYFNVVDLGFYIECMQKGTGKDVVTQKIIDQLSLKVEDTYAFGDSLNDLPMFKVCGHKVAIGHAPSEIKDLADYVTTLEEEGVAEALCHLGFITESEIE